MTSHLHGPNEHYSRTGSGETGGGGGSSGDRRFQMRVALIGAAGAIIAAAVGAVIGLKPWSHPGPSPPGGGGSTPASFPSGTYSTPRTCSDADQRNRSGDCSANSNSRSGDWR